MTMQPVSSATASTTNLDDGFPELLRTVKDRFRRVVHDGVKRLFRVEADGLYDLFLRELPPELRQHYTCRACRDFVERYGSVVTLDSAGISTSVMWEGEAPAVFKEAIGALRQAVHTAPIAGVFLSPDRVWGQPVTGEWHHFAVEPPLALVFVPKLDKIQGESLEKFRDRQLAAASAEVTRLREEYLMLSRGLGEFPLDVCEKALAMLRGGQLDRSEKCEGVATWLLELQQRLGRERNRHRREGMVWLAAATAPTGYCHVRSGLIGTLLEDVQGGVPFAELKRRFDAKVHPLAYQRPQAPPKAGTIAQAERLFEELRTAGALDRRFARFSDVQKLLWMPRPRSAPPVGGLFAHLREPGKAAALTEAGSQTVTWVKFRDTVLPTADSIAYRVERGLHNFAALTAAADPAAPPILQWDAPEARNTIASYCYTGGSTAGQWNLGVDTWVDVTGICRQAHQWNSTLKMDHQGDGVFFLLKGCRDTHHRSGGGLFVETLKSEYHAVRSVLEAHFKQAPIAEHAEEHACGLALSSNTKSCRHVFRVVSGGLVTTYTIDRWD